VDERGVLSIPTTEEPADELKGREEGGRDDAPPSLEPAEMLGRALRPLRRAGMSCLYQSFPQLGQ